MSALDAKLRAFEQTKGSQIAVLIVPTTQPEEIEQYSIRVAEQWRHRAASVSTTARSCVVALNDRRVRIEVGYGIEGALPDATANRIIQQDIVPQFKRGDYYGGINTGVDRIMRAIEGEPLPAPELSPPAQDVPGLFTLLPFLFIFALVGGSIFRRMFGRVGGALATGGVVGFLTWLLISILGISVVAGIIAFIFSLAGGMGGGPRGGGSGWYSRRHGSGWGYPGGFGGGIGGGGGSGAAASAVAVAVSGAAAPRAGGDASRVAPFVPSSRRHAPQTRARTSGPDARGDRAGDYRERTDSRRRDTIRRRRLRWSRAKSGPGSNPGNARSRCLPLSVYGTPKRTMAC